MRAVAAAASLAFALLMALSGCAGNPMALQRENQNLQQAQTSLAQRNQELQSRATTLDRDNQELQALLAQTRQQAKVTEDQLAAVRDQLNTANTQLAQLRDERQLNQRQTEALLASTRRRAGAQITANNSLQRNLQALSLPGIEVRADGDVVRIELPAARLFQQGTANLQPQSLSLVETVGGELARAYPQHIIGIEGHTDNDVVRTPQGFDNQQLSVARANAVYQHLVGRGVVPSGRLFMVGHGANHPVVSNATAAGKARNSRIELVIYPDRVAVNH